MSYKKIGTPKTVGELKELLSGLDDSDSFGFINQPIQSLYVRDGFVGFQLCGMQNEDIECRIGYRF